MNYNIHVWKNGRAAEPLASFDRMPDAIDWLVTRRAEYKMSTVILVPKAERRVVQDWVRHVGLGGLFVLVNA